MSQQVTIIPGRILRSLTNSNGTPVNPPWLSAPRYNGKFDDNQFVLIKCTPTNASSSIDLIAGTQSNAGAIFEKNLDGFSLIAGALYFRISARAKDGATADLVANNIRLSINSVELGRIYVDATSQKCGEHLWHSPTKDTRFATDGTHDLTITMTAADPNLEIYIEIGCTDA